MTVEEIMTADPVVLTPEDSVSRAGQIMRDRDIGFLPVVRDRESMTLVGLVTDRDITLRHVAENHWVDCAVETHMTGRGLFTATPHDDVRDVISLMEEHGVSRLPVLDAHHRVMGVVSRGDVLRARKGEA